MFSDDKGSWMTMFLTTIVSVFIFAYIYTAFLLIGGDAMKDYHISPYMDISNNIFMKAAATGTWCGDFFTAWMVSVKTLSYANLSFRFRLFSCFCHAKIDTQSKLGMHLPL